LQEFFITLSTIPISNKLFDIFEINHRFFDALPPRKIKNTLKLSNQRIDICY